MSTIFWIILAGALVTYMTRIGGHLILSRFERVHPRVEAGLNAVPAAVLTTLVAPAATTGGPAEWLALGTAIVVGMRSAFMVAFVVGVAVLILLRNIL